MPPKISERSNQEVGRWSTHAESVFNLLDKTFSDSGTGMAVSGSVPPISRGPHSHSKWENYARSSLDIKKARLRMEEVAAKLLAG